MLKINLYVSCFYLLILMHCINADTCPAECVCKKLKSQSNNDGELHRVQCGGVKNKITTLNEIDLDSLPSVLVQLDLSSNSLTSLSPTLNFTFLQKLDISKNKLTTLEPNIFKNLSNLRRLDLSSNSLKTINRDWLIGLNKLERLKLNGNQITTITRGTFDDLNSLKQLDISNNPLTCDCDLLWLLETSLKFAAPPKCAAPASFKGQLLRKLKIGVDIHCRSPVSNRDPTEIELKPDKNQVVYEGDSIKIRCRAPGVTPDIFNSGEEPYSSARIYWRFNLDDPLIKFREIKDDNRYLQDSGMLDSVLNIGIISRNHTGLWTCHLTSNKGNHSKSISLYVISNSTKYCPSLVTSNNKGTYIWPRTIVDNEVYLQCQGQQLSGLYHISYAVYYCSEFGTWINLNTTACPYISEVTKILEQFSKVNLNLTKGNMLESVRHLKNYSTDGKLLKDKMDIVFIARTIENYIVYVKTERDLGGFLIDIVSSLLNLNKKLLEDAQIEDRSCSRLVRAVETISEYTTSPQSIKINLAVDDFRVKPDNFNGFTCAWYSNRAKRSTKPFFCTSSTNLPYMMYEDELIEASIQIPSSLFKQLEQQGFEMAISYQMIFAMYDNNKFFPNYQMKEVVMSRIVGATLVDVDVANLSDTITVMYRYPLLQEVETPSLAWWDININNGIGGWNKNGCELSHYFHESLIFSCDRLSYFGMLQDIQYAPTSFITGAKFHYSHPAIYTGTFILIFTLFITILTYLLCFNSIQMARRAKHSLINTWIAICLVTYIFSFGIYQTEDIQLCQIIGIVLHYLSLSVLFWMCVSVTTMYKRLSKTIDSIHRPVDELPSTDQPIQKPILGLYLVGWGIALIVCGISGAVNMREYASHTYCFLYSAPALSAIFVPALILIVFIIVCSLMVRCAIRCSDVHGQLSEGTQATENVDLDLLEPNLPNIDRHSYRSISSQTASSNIEDPEHCPSKQLKAHIIVLIFYCLLWIFGALTARRLFKNYIPFDERVFSILYAFCASILGAFILFFYGIARSDVRSKWSYMKRVWCRTRSISDTNMNLNQTNLNPTPIVQTVANSAAIITNPVASISEINNSRSSSRTSSHTKSHNSSNILKGAVDLNNVMPNDPEVEAKIANVNLVVLHRQQYRTNNTVPFYNDNNGAEMFYNPHQSTVARKFFKKQRKNMIKHNNLGTRQRRTTADSDNASVVSGNNKNTLKMPHKTNTDIKTTNIFGSGTKINNINIHVEPIKEVKQQNKNILSDSGDESEILIDHVTGSVNRILAERENLKHLQQRQKYTKNNDGSPKQHDDDMDDKVQQSSCSNNELEEETVDDDVKMRTVSQQCSLEYSSGSHGDLGDLPDNDIETSDLKTDEDIDLIEKYNSDENINVSESLECNLTPENNEGMYSITDLSQNLMPDDSSSSLHNDFDTNDQLISHSHKIYENPLHLIDISDSTTTLDSDPLFMTRRYQTSEASVINSDDDDVDDDEVQCAPSSPVSASELDELYEQINRTAPQIIVHSRPNFANESRSRSPILFPPSISFESGLNDIEINTDYRFNAQGVVETTSSTKLTSDDNDDIHSDSSNSDELKIETTV